MILPRLSDLREVTTFGFDHAAVLELARRRGNLVFPNPFKAAVLVRDQTQYGFARMFQTLTEHPQITVGIFWDEGEALAWLATTTVSGRR